MLSYAGGALGLAGSLGGSLGYVPRARAQGSPPTPGGTLVVAGEAIGDNFGPAASFQGWAHVWVVQNVFESLYTTRDFKTLIPSLAMSSTASDDGRIHLPASQGRQVPRRDAVQRRGRRIQLHALPRQEPPLLRAGRRPGHLPGDAAAGREVRDAIDEHTVQIVRTNPMTAFLAHLCTSYGGIMSPASIKKYGVRDVGRYPVGTGPFVFEKGEKGNQVSIDGVRRLLGRSTLPRPGGRARDLGRADDDGQPAVGGGRPDPLHRLQGSGLLPEEPEPEGLPPSGGLDRVHGCQPTASGHAGPARPAGRLPRCRQAEDHRRHLPRRGRPGRRIRAPVRVGVRARAQGLLQARPPAGEGPAQGSRRPAAAVLLYTQDSGFCRAWPS